MKPMLAAISLVILSTAAPAQQPQDVLWNNLRFGISKAEVSALYPKKTTSIAPGCQARVNGEYVEGGLATVTLVSSRSDPAARCAEMIQATLASKYGRAESAQSYENRKCTPLSQFTPGKFGELCRQNAGEPVISVYRYGWMNGGVQIILSREEVCPCSDSPSSDVWSIVYRSAIGSDRKAASKL